MNNQKKLNRELLPKYPAYKYGTYNAKPVYVRTKITRASLKEKIMDLIDEYLNQKEV